MKKAFFLVLASILWTIGLPFRAISYVCGAMYRSMERSFRKGYYSSSKGEDETEDEVEKILTT